MKIKRCFRALPLLQPSSFAVLLLLATAPASAGAHVPDWVKQAAAQPMPRLEPRTNAVILMREDTLNVAQDGKITRLHREVRKILSPRGHDAADTRVYFDSQSKVNYLRAWTLTADGREFELKDKDVVEGSQWETFVLYSDERFKFVSAIAADPGSVVAFEYERQERPYRPDVLFMLQEDVPVARQRVTINLPPSWEYRTAFAHMSSIEPKQLTGNSWQWDVPELAALHQELLAPSDGERSARMSIALFGNGHPAASGDWKSLGIWYQQLAAGRTDTPAEVEAKATELTAGKTDFVSQVRAITNFMQDQIRYVAISIGVGGYQPHSAADVYQHRYGDCKDKATLLIGMLRAVGIHANYLMVDYDHMISADVPSSTADHMIVAIDVPDGVHDESLQAIVKRKNGQRVLIFDPTEQYVPSGQIEQPLQGSYGLIFDGANTELIKLPITDPAQNVLRRKGDFVLSADGSLKGDLDEDRQGPLASHYRGLFATGDQKLEEKMLERGLRESFSNFTLDNFKTEHVAQRDLPLLVHYKITADGYGRNSGAMMLVRPRVLGSAQEDVRTDEPRRYPVEFTAERAQIEDYTVHFPEGFKVEDLPDPVAIDTDFASYTSKTEVVGNALHYTREYRLKAMELPASRYGELTKFVGQVANDEHNQAILRKAN